MVFFHFDSTKVSIFGIGLDLWLVISHLVFFFLRTGAHSSFFRPYWPAGTLNNPKVSGRTNSSPKLSQTSIFGASPPRNAITIPDIFFQFPNHSNSNWKVNFNCLDRSNLISIYSLFYGVSLNKSPTCHSGPKIQWLAYKSIHLHHFQLCAHRSAAVVVRVSLSGLSVPRWDAAISIIY